MKIKYILIFSLLLFACLDDKGNYDYSQTNELNVSNINDKYVIEQFTALQISPIIEGTQYAKEDDFDYLWYIYDDVLGGNGDTLSFEKNLNSEVKSAIGTYILNLKITDKNNGTIHVEQSNLEIINSYTKGLIVLSEVNEEAQLTFVNSIDQIIEDIYYQVNGQIPGRNPVKVQALCNLLLPNAEDMIVIMTDDDKGGVVINPEDFSYVKDIADLFYFSQIVKPQLMIYDDYSNFEALINNGDLHYRDARDYGYPQFGNRIKGDYELAPFSFFSPLIYQAGFFFDQKNQRFVRVAVPLQGTSIIPFDDDEESTFNPNNMGMNMLWGELLDRTSLFAEECRAVMEDEKGNRYMITFNLSATPNFTPGNKWLMNHEGARTATSFTTCVTTSNFIYYAHENKISYMSFTTGNFMATYDFFESNQVVDYIECVNINGTEQLCVGVSDGSGNENSGSVYIYNLGTDGALTLAKKYENICGRVVDFEYKSA